MISKNEKETIEIAKILFNKILENTKNKGALVVGLSGDLGAGKTTFTKVIAKYLKIKNKIFSPTYVIMKKYPFKLKEYKFFYHIDAYRLENEKELLHLGWEEIISNKENLIFIEWPENVSKAMPSDSKYIYITHTKNGGRNFKLK